MKALTLAGLVCAAVCGCTQSPHEKARAECRENYPIDGPQSTWDWKTCPYGRDEYDGCDDEDLKIMVACIRAVQLLCNKQQYICFERAKGVQGE